MAEKFTAMVGKTEGLFIEPHPVSAYAGQLRVQIRVGDQYLYAGLDYREAGNLIGFLERWRAMNGTPASGITPEPVYGPDSLIGQLITQAVAAEVAKVLPLHLAKIPAVCERTIPMGSLVGSACRDCGYAWLAHQMQAGMQEPDPEPHDVGHPVYEDARPHPLDVGTVPVGGWWCPECKHGWGEHTAGYCWGGGTECHCPDERPAPVPVTESDKVWGEQGAPPKPVALECICDKHNHRPVDRPGSPATCVYRGCECKYRGAP